MNEDSLYKKLMKQCLKLAKKGEGKVAPNPMVGAIIINNKGEIVATGHHKQYGAPHAEQDAIAKAGNKTKNATLIVNLEPCNHQGKTPPCADLIIQSGIKTLVVATKDPNPSVQGGGLEKCKKAGIKIIYGVLEDKANKLNEIFFKNQRQKMPFVILKSATTLDGKIATQNGDSKWITNEKSRAFVHKLRNTYDSILTGSNTIKKDNPSLNCRIKNGKNPIRIILDTNLTTSPRSKVYQNDGTKVIIAASPQAIKAKNSIYPDNVSFLACKTKSNHINLNDLLQKLYNARVTSILVEAGTTLGSAFLSGNLVDKFYHFKAPKIIADNSAQAVFSGTSKSKIAGCTTIHLDEVKTFGDDIMSVYYFN